jgi:hypothetical protein
MTCCYDDKEIAAECPHHSSEGSKIPTEIKGTEHDVEAQEVGKDIPHILRQPKVISLNNTVKTLRTLIGRSTLIGRHTTEG